MNNLQNEQVARGVDADGVFIMVDNVKHRRIADAAGYLLKKHRCSVNAAMLVVIRDLDKAARRCFHKQGTVAWTNLFDGLNRRASSFVRVRQPQGKSVGA